MRTSGRTRLGWLTVAALVVAACSGDDDTPAVDASAGDLAVTATTQPPEPVTTDPPPDAAALAEPEPDPEADPAPEPEPEAEPGAAPLRCDPDAAADAGPITVRVWHPLGGDLVNYLQVLVGQFEAEHPGITIQLQQVTTGYPGTIEEFAAAPDDQLPDVIIGSNQTVRLQADSGRFIPVVECTGGETPDQLTDLLPVIARTFTVDGTLWAAPFNTSAPVMLYDRDRWTRAGLDPDDPPTDLTELEQTIRRLRDSGEAPVGAVLYDRAAMWFVDQHAARTDRLLAEPVNGRSGAAIEQYAFDHPDAVDALSRLSGLFAADDIRYIGANESGIDDLAQMVHPVEPAGVTFNSSAVLGDIVRLLDAGGIPDVDVGVAPFPGPGAGSTAGGGAWWLHDRGDPVLAGAAWTFVEWFTRPELIAEIAAYTGYVPTTLRAAEHPITQAHWADQPVFRVAYDQLAATPDSDAGAGLQVGPLVEVYRNLELAAVAAMRGADPGDELRGAEERSLEITRIYAETFVAAVSGG